MLSIPVDEPDIKALIPAAIAQEGELLRVRRPPGPNRPLVRGGQLEDALAGQRRAVDLERPRAVPGERNLAAVGREIDAAPDVIDVRNAGELLHRQAAIAVADRARLDDRRGRLDVRLRIRDGRGRPGCAGRLPVLGKTFWPFSCRGGLPPFCRGGWPPHPLTAAGARPTFGTHGPLWTLHQVARRCSDDERFRSHCGFPRRGHFPRHDGVVWDELVFESPLVCAIPGSLQEDAELLARFRQRVLQCEEGVLSGVPHRRATRRKHSREAQRKQCSRGVACEVEIAAHQNASGLAEEQDCRAVAIGTHTHGAGVRSHELVIAEDEIRSARNPSRVVRVHGDLHPERLAVLTCVGGPRRIRRDQQRRRTRATHEPERAFAEGRSIDEEVSAVGVVDDVLALVLERLVQLEDP